MKQKFILWFSDIKKEDLELVGSRAVNLAELMTIGMPIAPGFVVTSTAYKEKIDNLAPEIFAAYKILTKKNKLVTIIGPNMVFTNVSGEATVVDFVRRCWTNLSPHLSAAVIVQQAVTPDKSQVMTKAQHQRIAKLSLDLRKYFYFPQETEFILSDDQLYLTKSRPVILPIVAKTNTTTSHPKPFLTPILEGFPASPGIKSGPVGEILVVKEINNSLLPKLKRAIAVIVEKVDEVPNLEIPVVVGVKNATKILKTGQVITVNGNTGRIYSGAIYKGSPLNQAKSVTVGPLPLRTVTKVFTSVNNQAFFCAAPKDVVLLDALLQSNPKEVVINAAKLTLLTLDGDSNISDPAMLHTYYKIIKTCQKHHVACNFFHEIPIDQELLEKLIKWGITGVIVPQDGLDYTKEAVYQAEATLVIE